jgi:hypothetical protein
VLTPAEDGQRLNLSIVRIYDGQPVVSESEDRQIGREAIGHEGDGRPVGRPGRL